MIVQIISNLLACNNNNSPLLFLWLNKKHAINNQYPTEAKIPIRITDNTASCKYVIHLIIKLAES
jgi:hypothetical protein